MGPTYMMKFYQIREKEVIYQGKVCRTVYGKRPNTKPFWEFSVSEAPKASTI